MDFKFLYLSSAYLISRSQRPMGVIETFSSTQGAKQLKNIVANAPFSYPKDTNLISWILDRNEDKNCKVLDFFAGFRVIIMTQANSQVNTRVLELLPKLKTKKLSGWCAV